MPTQSAALAIRAAKLIVALVDHDPECEYGDCHFCGVRLDHGDEHRPGCLWVEARSIAQTAHLINSPFHEESDKETSS